MATVYDLMPEDQKARFPLETLTPEAQKWVSTAVPDSYPADRRARLGAGLVKIMPRMTRASRAISEIDRTHPRAGLSAEQVAAGAPQRMADEYAGLPPSARLARRFVDAMGRALPSRASAPAAPTVPAATNLSERVADIAGGAAPFIPAATGITLATAGLGAAPLLAGALGVGGAMALPAGTPKQRAIRGATGAAAALATGPLAGAASGSLGGVAEAIPVVGSVVAPAVRTLARAATAGATFGGLQPIAENTAERALRRPGEPEVPALTGEDVARGGAEMFFFDLFSHGASAAVGRARGAVRPATPIPTERVAGEVDGNLARVVDDPTARPEHRAAAARALRMLEPSFPAPADGAPVVAAGQQAAQRIMQEFGRLHASGKAVSLQVGHVFVKNGIVADVRVYPWDHEQVRILVLDKDTGGMHVGSYTDLPTATRALGVVISPEPPGASATAPPAEPERSPAAGQAPGPVAEGGGPVAGRGTEPRAPAVTPPAPPAPVERPRVPVDLPFRDSISAQRAAEGMNRTNPDLEARVVMRGGRPVIEVNGDAAEAPRKPAAVAPPPKAVEPPPAAPPAEPALPTHTPEGEPYRVVGETFPSSRAAARWMEGSGITGARVVRRGEGSWDVEAPEGAAKEFKARGKKSAGPAPVGEQGSNGGDGTSTPGGPAEPPLPRELSGARPRYGYGSRNFELDFESDADRAAYIASQEKKSRRDADYRKHLTDQGFTDAEIAAHGQRVRDTIKAAAKGAKVEDTSLRIARHERVKPPEEPTYTRSSGEKVVISKMGDQHLVNAEAKAADGPEREALRAEIERRGLARKAPPKPVEPPPQLPEIEPEPEKAPAPEPEPTPEPEPAAPPAEEVRPAYAEEFNGRDRGIQVGRKVVRVGGVKPEEANAIKHALPGKSFSAAADWLAKKSPDPITRLIAEKVAARLREREQMGASPGSIRWMRAGAQKRGGAYVYSLDHEIRLYPGHGARNALHELIHAATVAAIDDVPQHKLRDRRAAELTQAKADLTRLRNAIHATAQTSGDHFVKYMVTNDKEMLAVGLSDRVAQQWLDTIPYESGTLWGKFVDTVRRLIGLETKHSSALTELLRIGDEFLRPTGEPMEPRDAEPAPEPEVEAPPAKTFAEHFADAWAKRLESDTAEAVAERVAAETGMKLPPDFDPLAESHRLTQKALSDAGQGDMFAGMDPPAATESPARRAAPPAEPEEPQPDLPTVDAGPESDAKITPIEGGAKAGDFSLLPEKFQNRFEGVKGGIKDSKIQAMLRKHGGKFDSSELVASPLILWTDKKGEAGEAGTRYLIDGHHRYEVGTKSWEKKGEKFVATGKVDRTFPAVEFHGDMAQAIEYSKDVNRRGTPNSYLENVARARELAADGKTPQEVSDQINVTPGEAKSLIELGHLDDEVLRDFFSLRGGKPTVDYAFGEHLGRAVKDFPEYFAAETQRAEMRHIIDGKYKNPSEYKAALKMVTDVLEAAKQSDMFKDVKFSGLTPAQISEAAMRALREIDTAKRSLNAMRKGIERAQKETGLAGSGGDMLLALQARLEKAKAIQKKFGFDIIRDRIVREMGKGIHPSETLKKIRAEIDDEMGPNSVNQIIASEMEVDALDVHEELLPTEEGLDELHSKFLLADVIRSTDRAYDALKRRYGKQFSTLRYISNGKVVSTLELDPPQDTWQQYALVRAVHSLTGFGGGNVALPPGDPASGKPGPRDVMHKVGAAATHEIHAIHTQLGHVLGDDGFRALGKAFSKNDDLFWRAVNAPPEEKAREGYGGQQVLGIAGDVPSGPTREALRAQLPKELRDKVEPVAALMKSLLEAENADRRARGIPEITSRFYDNYITHTVDSIQPLDHLLRLLDPELAYDPEAMRERKLSVYRRRGGYDDGKVKSFQESFRRYVDTTVTARHDRALVESIREWLTRPESVKDSWRSSIVRTWARAWLYREKNSFEDNINNIARRILFTKAQGAVGFATEKIVLDWLGKDAVEAAKRRLQPLADNQYSWQYVDPSAVKGSLVFTDPRAWTKVGSAGGLDVYVGNNGHMLAGDPEWRPAFKLISASMATVRDPLLASWAHLRGGSFTAEMARQQILRDQRLLKYERAPWDAVVSGWNKGMTSAFVGFNVPVAYKIMLSNLGAIHNRYGPITATRATLRSIDMMLRKAGRARARAAYEKGEITRAEFRRRTPALTTEEAAFDYLRMGQGSQLYYRQMATGEMGRSFTPERPMTPHDDAFNRAVDRLAKPLSKLAYYVGPFGPHAIAEVVTRGIQLHAAWIEGLDRGMSLDGIKAAYEATEEGRRSAATDILRSAEVPGTLANHIAAESAATLFTYDRTGQPYYMSNSTGRLFGSLSSWGTQSLIHNFLRPLEGAARVTAEMGGRAVGREMGWASPDHYRAARLFAAQVVGAGLMNYLTDKTRLRLYAGTNTSGLILALMAMREVYKANHHGAKNEDFERYLADAFAEEAPAMVSSMTKEGRDAHGGRGVLGIWFSPFAQTASDIEKRGLIDTSLNLATTRIVPYKGQFQKVVRANPALFRDNPQFRWVADALGVKSFIEGSTLDRLKSTVGLLPESHTHRIRQIPRKQRRAYDEQVRKKPMPGGPVRPPGSLGSL